MARYLWTDKHQGLSHHGCVTPPGGTCELDPSEVAGMSPPVQERLVPVEVSSPLLAGPAVPPPTADVGSEPQVVTKRAAKRAAKARRNQ